MGHFGARPIRLVWFTLVLPALLLNYFGQGALLLAEPSAAENPFYHLAPDWGQYPLVALATAAAVIASQAVISGAFSLTRQAVQLGYCPRVSVEHTSSKEIGQIYIPSVNWWLMIVTIAVVLGFRSASGLAGAYGVAVTSTMVITTLLLHVVSREVWGWSLLRATLVAGGFLLIDLSFFAANLVKVPLGGWLPLILAAGIYTLMATWKTGRQILSKRLQEKSVPLKILMGDLAADPPPRVPGTAVFMSGNPGGTPPALVHNLAHNKVLHEKVIFLTVITEEVPHVPAAERVTVKHLGKGFHEVIARYGFMEDPSIQDVIEHCAQRKLIITLEGTTFFLGREELVSTDRPGMARWRERLFAFMSRNALRATAFFQIPSTQVFEVGAQVEL
jgi:KUP system potassium uptake protein